MMYLKYQLLVLCLCIIGVSLAVRDEEGDRDRKRNPDNWESSNTMSREKGEHHIKPSDTIDIDDNPMMYDEGSADSEQDDDNDWSSGMGDDDEDADNGSGDSLGGDSSDCQKLRDDLKVRELPGAYMPRCTEKGEFEKMQCRKSSRECWCVDPFGKVIKGTNSTLPKKPDCNNLVETIIKPKDRTPSNTGNKDEQTPDKENQDKDIPNKIDNMAPADPDIEPVSAGPNHVEHTGNDAAVKTTPTIFGHPGILAAIIGGAVVGLLCAVLFVMFIVYRMRKKDEGSYALDEPKRSPSHSYTRAPTKEFYA